MLFSSPLLSGIKLSREKKKLNLEFLKILPLLLNKTFCGMLLLIWSVQAISSIEQSSFVSFIGLNAQVSEASMVTLHCVKSVHIWSFSRLHLPPFGLNTEGYGVSSLSVFSLNAGKYGPEKLRIQTLFTQCWYSTFNFFEFASKKKTLWIPHHHFIWVFSTGCVTKLGH